MKKSVSYSAILAIIIVVISGAWYFTSQKEKTAAPEIIKVKIADLAIVQGLPLYLSIEKGYFKDAGLEIERVKFDNPNQLVDSLISGQADFAIGAGTGIVGIAETKNPDHLRIFALAGGDDKISNDSVLVKTDSQIKSIAELQGKKLGILPGIQWRTIAQEILAKNNLTADKDVTLVELAAGLQAQALGSGQIDTLLGVEPVPTIIKANNIGKEIISTPTVQYISNPFYGGSGVVNFQFAKQNPNTTAKVLEVFNRAINEINQTPDTTRQYLKNYTALTDTLISKVPISLFKMYGNFTSNDINATQKFYDTFSNLKVVDTKMNFQKFLYSPSSK